MQRVFFAFIVFPFLFCSVTAYSESDYYDESPTYGNNYSEYSWQEYESINSNMNDEFMDHPVYSSEDSYPEKSYSSKKRHKVAKHQHKSYQPPREEYADADLYGDSSDNSRLPTQINSQGEDVIVVDPKVHAWGAYTATGKLIKSGLASAGAKWCPDLHRPCRTRTGIFRIYSLGNSDCISSRYPLGEGGAPMPYCMYFNGNQGLHGSHELAEANISHGCVRMSVDDAKWLRFNFSHVGTKVIVKSY